MHHLLPTSTSTDEGQRNSRAAVLPIGSFETMHEDMHSGEIETSIILYAHPELVRDGYETADCIADDRRHLLVKGMSVYTNSGVIGRPSLASADKGKAVLASLVQSFADILRVLDT